MASTVEITKSIKLPVTIDIALRNIKDAKVKVFFYNFLSEKFCHYLIFYILTK